MWQKAFENKITGQTAVGSFGSAVAMEGDLIVSAVKGTAYIYQRNSLGVWNFVKRLVTSDEVISTFLGSKVAISGDTVVFGAREAAYIFQKDQGGTNNWGQVKKLVASDGTTDDQFGSSVTISGNTVVIGAYFENHDADGVTGDELKVGAAYVFQRNRGGTNNWGELKKLVANDNAEGDTFGCGLAMSGTTLVVGACNESHDTNGAAGDEGSVGAAYIFEQNQGGTNNFGQVKKLIAGDGAALDQFGVSVAISGTTLVVGAHAEDHDSNGVAGDEVNVGAAYIFQKDQGGTNNWGQVKKLVSSDGATLDFFGHAISISGNTVVVGAYGEAHDTNGDGTDETRVGAAYIFHKDQGGTNNWGQLRKLTAFDGAEGDSFSEDAVSISGGVVVVGAWSDDNAGGTNAGAIYIYE